MKERLFNTSMKMADIIIENHMLLSVLQRFGISLGFGDMTVREVSAKYCINETLFLLVCNMYTFEGYLPSEDTIKALNGNSLVDYLKKSHTFYRQEKLASIEQKLEKMKEECTGNHLAILNKFFIEYKNEVLKHLEYEETKVFPYIESILNGAHVSEFSISQYEDNHGNIEDKLSDLKNIIIKYLPENQHSQQRIDVLYDICAFEEDLNKHSLIEDRVLIPFVERIEKSHE